MDCLHAEGKNNNAGFFIINCQSFAKIKVSLCLHRGQEPAVAL